MNPEMSDLGLGFGRGLHSTHSTPMNTFRTPPSPDTRTPSGRHIHFGGTTDIGETVVVIEAYDDHKKDKNGDGQIRSAPHMGTRWSQVFRTSWRESQSLLNWSLMPVSAGTSGDEEQDKKGKNAKFLGVEFGVSFLFPIYDLILIE
jgi:hypothetical protein